MVAATVMVAVGVLIATLVAGSLGQANSAARTTITRTPVTTTVAPTTTPPPTTTPAPPPPTVKPTTVSEYVVSGKMDNAGQMFKVIDGDPTTGWDTDVYKQQFPLFIPGLGIMAGFGQPVSISSVTITSPSPGTVVEIHAAAGPDVQLAAAPLLATGTLQAGQTTIPLPAGQQPSPYLLIWLTKLGTTQGGFMSEIDEITFQSTG